MRARLLERGEAIRGSQAWSSIFRPGSIFRKGYTDSPRNRSYVVMNSVLYHLHLGVGEPPPDTAEGEHLLAHELAHVLQGGDSGPVRRYYALVDRKTRKEIPAGRMTDLQNLYGD